MHVQHMAAWPSSCTRVSMSPSDQAEIRWKIKHFQFKWIKTLHQNNFNFTCITVLFTFSKSQRYYYLPDITQKTISNGNSRKLISRLREIVQTYQEKFHYQFHFASTFKHFLQTSKFVFNIWCCKKFAVYAIYKQSWYTVFVHLLLKLLVDSLFKCSKSFLEITHFSGVRYSTIDLSLCLILMTRQTVYS